MRWFAKEEVRVVAPRFLLPKLTLGLPTAPGFVSYRCMARGCPADQFVRPAARPDNFLDAFYLSRDDGKEVQPTA